MLNRFFFAVAPMLLVAGSVMADDSLLSRVATMDLDGANAAVADMEADGKLVGSIGTGIWTINHLGLAGGKQIADCVHTSDEFKRASGATWMTGQDLVTDGQLITATSTTDASPLLETMLQRATEN